MKIINKFKNWLMWKLIGDKAIIANTTIKMTETHGIEINTSILYNFSFEGLPVEVDITGTHDWSHLQPSLYRRVDWKPMKQNDNNLKEARRIVKEYGEKFK